MRRIVSYARPAQRPSALVPLTIALTLFALALSLWPITTGDASASPRAAHLTRARDAAVSSFIASVDTMKESRDTETRPLSDAQIADDVNVAVSLNTTYITVDTHWDYPAYMLRWADAVHAAGRRVWFRIHPDQWGNNNGTTGIMTPAQYEDSEQAFILANPAIFRSGDILDPCPEPENGLYWRATYGYGWTAGAPNAATEAYNRFIRDTTNVADAALHQDGVDGVITTVRSTNSFFASHPGALEATTVARMGRVTVDSYPEGTTTDPRTAMRARIDELNTIEKTWGVPVVIGEMGYSNKVSVDDATQEAVLKAEFGALASLPYLAGANYWVGAGTDNSGGYTHIFSGSTGAWTPRPAAAALAALYQFKTSTDPQAITSATPSVTSPTASVTAAATSTPLEAATNLATPTNTAANTPTTTSPPAATPTSTRTPPATLAPPAPTRVVATATMPVATPSPSGTPTLLSESPSMTATPIVTPSATVTGTTDAATTIAQTPAASQTPLPVAPATATAASAIKASATTAADPTPTPSSAASTPLPTMSPPTVTLPAHPTNGPTATVVFVPTVSVTLVAPTPTSLPAHPPIRCRRGRRCTLPRPHRPSNGSSMKKTPGSQRSVTGGTQPR